MLHDFQLSDAILILLLFIVLARAQLVYRQTCRWVSDRWMQGVDKQQHLGDWHGS